MQPDTIPFWKSAVIRRCAVAFILLVLSAFKVPNHLTEADIAPYVDQAFDLFSALAIAWAAHARATKPMPAIVATQKEADVANASPIIVDPTTKPEGENK